MKDYFISIDIGTSSCKTVLLDESGRVVATASSEYPTFFAPDGSSRQDARQWWHSAQSGLAEIASACPEAKNRVAAIGIDAQSSVMLALDGCGEPLFPAMIWNDSCAQAQKRRIDECVGQDMISRINGNHNDATNVAPKIMWFRDNHPELYRRTDRIVSAVGYIVYKLTGRYSLSISEAGLTQLTDIERGVWSDELISACGIDRKKLPEIVGCEQIVGTLKPDVAASVGLAAGIPVVAGAMDACACALGTGVTHRGDAFVTGGTVTALGVCADRPIRNGVLHIYHHVVPGLWASVGGVDFGGGSFRWCRDRFFKDEPEPYARMNALAAQAAPGCGGLLFLPSLVGQRCPQWDDAMRGAFVGITPNHGAGEFVRAIMEGNAYGVREIMELQAREGAQLSRVMIAGGIARSDLWMRIFATVLGKPVRRVHSLQDTAYGNMICAGVGIGMFPNFDVELSGRRFEPIEPLDGARAYERYYETFLKIYPALKGIFAELHNAEEKA